MTSKEFWEYDPQLFVSYRTFFINKKKREYEESNYMCWLNGLYIHKGNNIIETNLAVNIAKMLGDKKAKYCEETYPNKPFDLSKNETPKENEKEKRKKEYQKNLNFFGSIKDRYIKQIEMKGE